MKCLDLTYREPEPSVTLRVRVWIEIYHYYGMHDEGYVTLRVRVWIEIYGPFLRGVQ